MKLAFRSAIAALMLVGPIAAAPALAAPERQGQQQSPQVGERAPAAQTADARRGDGRAAREQRQSWRDDRPDARWDEAQHNGYYQNNTWRAGPPPASRAGKPGVTLGYQPWSKGQRLGYYRNRYEVVDYRTINRSRPRRGYHWVRDERGDDLLVAIATGVISDIIINSRN